ncbi:glycosyltransferase [Paenibacillus xylanexedens]|uniref:glycosyltransferase n=1 Tax=Paenibacillus xylanexedens TaxID=528191 RepID=UPI001C8E9207|nr:glycosyltransferase [Paenibacillus xylanexedens]MBY0118887.1 glycosyltransferase [Paenibacillus xylanexedens]
MSVSHLTETINAVLAKNTKKNNMLRSSSVFKASDVSNLGLNEINQFYVLESSQETQITFSVSSEIQFVKFIYCIFNSNDQGKVSLVCHGEQGKSQRFDIGNFSGTSVPFYLKTHFNISKIVIHISSTGSFDINQLELIGISKSEYVYNKLKMYGIKFNKTIKLQPHLRKKFFKEVKASGLKLALTKVKQKLYSTEPQTNIIEFHNQVKIDSKSVLNNEKAILFIVHDAQNAGASILSLNMIKILKNVYGKKIVAILLKGGPLEKDFATVAEVISLHQHSLSFLENEKEVSGVIRSLSMSGIKYCIANSVVSSILVKILKNNGIETISLIHELPTSIHTYNFTEAAKLAAQYATRVVFPNQFVKDNFSNFFQISEEKSLIMPQGIYKKRSKTLDKELAKTQLHKKLGINNDAVVLLGCGYGDLRKGLDLFFKLAVELVHKKKLRHMHFVWMGDTDSILEKWLMHDANTLGLGRNIHMVGFQTDPLPIFEGSDLFVLTSREDPFPSIALEAIDNGTPVIAFKDGGGMPELVTELGVNSIPYIDVSAMAMEVERVLGNQDLYSSIVEKGHKAIEEKYNFTKYVGDILKSIEPSTVEKLEYKVSVIIPNYNYESFIEQRLLSIINQTVKPYEIIFLDDVSSDNSVNLARKILNESNIKHKIIENQQNVGCFGQWINGIKEAEGDIIWIAEADDLCESVMLERLLPAFKDQEVNLSYAQSQIIDEYSNKVNYRYTQYTDDLSINKWLESYCISGKDEVVQGLAIKNTIPNASAVLMRASALNGIEQELTNYKIGGDWFGYLFVLKQGKISFTPEILNYHRRHSQSIISRNEQKVDLYRELLEIKQYIIETYELPVSMLDRFLEQVPKDYERLGCSGYSSRNIFDNPELAEKMKLIEKNAVQKFSKINYLSETKNLLFVTPDFEVGGGQMLVIRLANYFSTFQNVYIYNARPWLEEESVLKMISSSVNVLPSSGNPEELMSHIENLNIDTINSHIWWSDKIVFNAIKDNKDINWVLSMHGCYEALQQNPDWDHDFLNLVPMVLERANHIIHATDKNLKIFDQVRVTNRNKIKKVYYGYDLQSIPKKDKAILGIKQNEFVFGLVSRAIKEKGWEESIQAIIKLNKENNSKSHLILVGESEYSKKLKGKYKDYDYIHFIMDLKEPSEWIGWVKVFDVALLPTYFISESLPNSVIEYLAYGKPVISTDIGEIRYMIRSLDENKSAGIILELSQGVVNVDDIVNAMKTMTNETDKFLEYKENTSVLFKQFTMHNFASSYYDYF